MRIILAFAALTLAMPVMADEATPSASAKPPKPVKPKKICRAAEASSTSRIGAGYVCKTEQEWAADADAGGSKRGSRSVLSATPD